MGRKLGKYSKLIFKAFLLIQLYCYHNLEVNAIPPRGENFKTCDERYHNNNETYFEEEPKKSLQRTKRPVRLLPRKFISKKEKNGTKNKNFVYYGPAGSCAEISKLGYTLNGYYLVKGKNQTNNNKVEMLSCRFKHPDGSKEAKEERIGFVDLEVSKSTKFMKRRSQEPSIKTSPETIESNTYAGRHKRPARLIPSRILLGKHRNNTGNENATAVRFYGPASSCEELGKLGYTLNGLYLVDCKDKASKEKIEVIECRFKQLPGSKEEKEERLGFINIEVKKTKTVRRRYLNAVKETSLAVRDRSRRIILQRPARLLPLQLLYGNEKNGKRFYGPPSNCSELEKLGYTLNGYYLVTETDSSHKIEISLCKFRRPFDATESLFKEERFALVTIQRQVFRHIPLDHGRNESYPLMNTASGKCLVVKGTVPKSITPEDCNSSNVTRWKLSNINKQLCDESAQCITTSLSAYKSKSPLFLIPKLSTNSFDRSGNIGNLFLTLGKSQIKTFYLNNVAFCVGVTKSTPSSSLRVLLPQKITLEPCQDNYSDNFQYQNWSFISFE